MKLLFLIVMIIVLMDSIRSGSICEFNMIVLNALNKSVGLYERNYSSFTVDDFEGYVYLECKVLHLNFILR